MDFPVVNDGGARESTATVFYETNAAYPFKIRTNIVPLLEEPIREISAGLHIPSDPRVMTPQQQQWVLERLDRYVQFHDPELWRTKQISDFFGGIWAQVYGPAYNTLIVPFLATLTNCRRVLVIALGLIAFVALRRVRGMARSAAGAEQLAPEQVVA